MIKVGIVGASGYTGEELARLICNHPEAELTVATSRQSCGQKLSDVYPNLRGFTDLELTDVQVADLAEKAELLFTAVPHQTAMAIVPALLGAGCKVVDLSADYRISDPVVYEKWYQPHTSPELLADAVYGLPELKREQIRKTSLVANPGCYPTSIILAAYPLLKKGLIVPETIIADSKSGASGAGRGANVGTLFCEVTEGFKAYKVGEHRHTPEIEQEISLAAGRQVTISFTPHLLPISRGILSTVYATVTKGTTEEEIRSAYEEQYDNERFVRFCGNAGQVATQFVRGSNFCDIGFKLDSRTGRVVIVSAIDNLVKGASGQAVQNMNLMCGLPENMGLEIVPLFP
ncbi:MAG: N-acetyl-gamma-glutamyl-phosphate reductase [Proteobacteria bacterium]|nr:N-acetyl-gamma-glutamyl-phosphate reductase [Pseudomonadota bacterium]MBU1739196.1 N-acetyl-gamma-glutamyl-phosphate reductase [Pseudomonadota bacterium]